MHTDLPNFETCGIDKFGQTHSSTFIRFLSASTGKLTVSFFALITIVRFNSRPCFFKLISCRMQANNFQFSKKKMFLIIIIYAEKFCRTWCKIANTTIIIIIIVVIVKINKRNLIHELFVNDAQMIRFLFSMLDIQFQFVAITIDFLRNIFNRDQQSAE